MHAYNIGPEVRMAEISDQFLFTCRSLILHRCYRVSNKGIQYVGKGLKNLKILDVTNCPQLSLDGLDIGNHVQLIHS